MRLPVLPESSRLARWGLILLSFLLAVAAGMASRVLSTPLAPLAVGGLVIAATFGLIMLQHPLPALYLLVFLFWLPDARALNPVVLRPPLDIYDLALLLALLAWGLQLVGKRTSIVWDPTMLLIGALMIWGTISLFWADDAVMGRKALVQWTISFLALFLTVNEIDSLAKLDNVMKAIALAGWTLTIGGIGTILVTHYTIGDRLQVWEINENMYGLYLITCLPGVLWLVMRASGSRKALNMILSLIFVAASMVLILLSGSRGTSVSLVIIFVAFWLWKPTRPWALIGVICVVVAVISAPFVFLTILNRLSDTTQADLGGRPILWEASMILIRDNPWIGKGAGNGPTALIPYIRSISDVYGYRTEIPSHNAILEVGIDFGLPGIVLYLAIFVGAVGQFLNRIIQLYRAGRYDLYPYFALVSCTFIGYISSWIKGGGLSNHSSYFLFLALLLIPSRLKFDHPCEQRVQQSTACE